jgi:UDP-glucose 4-epimerase
MSNSKDNKVVSMVAGGAGFIGANLVPRLLEEGRHVLVVDNYSRGSARNLGELATDPRVSLIEADIADRMQTAEVFRRAAAIGTVSEVWHLAANSDIPAGVLDSDVDFKDTFCTTFELLRAMREFGVQDLHFASSSAIYGDLGDQSLHEAIGPLLPISNYGAMKLASEAQASAAAESFLNRVNLFRFPNVVGVPATHGVLLDFVNKLVATPDVLQVLGDGTQQKAYLHVSDLVAAMLAVRARSIRGKVEVVNIGPTDEGVTVRWIAERVVARVSPQATMAFGKGNKGWVGDVPKFNYSTAKLQSYGWVPTLGSAAAIERAIDEIARQQGV